MNKTGYVRYVVALLLMLALAGFYAVNRDLPGRYKTYQQSNKAVKQAADDVARLETEVAQAKQRLADLESDPVELEAAVRRVLRMVRPGETVYRFEPVNEPNPVPQP